MARPNQKFIREKLEEYAETMGKFDSLSAQKTEAMKPHQEKFEKASVRVGKEFDAEMLNSQADMQRLQFEIETEIKKGFDESANSFAVKKVESELAFVEVNTREEREISAEEWLSAIPKSDQAGGFFDTLKVLITKAEKFRSDIVAKLAKMKRTHTISIRLK